MYLVLIRDAFKFSLMKKIWSQSAVSKGSDRHPGSRYKKTAYGDSYGFLPPKFGFEYRDSDAQIVVVPYR